MPTTSVVIKKIQIILLRIIHKKIKQAILFFIKTALFDVEYMYDINNYFSMVIFPVLVNLSSFRHRPSR